MPGQGEPDLREQMRLGVAEALRRAGGLRNLSGLSLMSVLCAAALAPLAAAAGAGQPIMLAGMGIVGSVGANVLTDLVMGAVGRLRGSGEEPSPAAVESDLAGVLERSLGGSGETAADLRAAAAALLHGVDAVGILVQAASAQNDELLPAMLEGFAGLGGQFSEFEFVMEDVRRVVWDIRASLRRHEATSRAERDRNRERELFVLGLLEAAEHGSLTAAARAGVTGERSWPGCPYLGLRPFKEEDAQVFYGRNELAGRLVQRLSERVDGGGILLVTGSSGAGKSSLLEAGVLPRLAAGALGPGSGGWPRLMMKPTASPLRALALRLAELSGTNPVSAYHSLLTAPGETPLMIHQAVRAIAGPAAARRAPGQAAAVTSPRLVLVIDQFEEVFTLGQDTTEREAFVAALHAAATVPPGATGIPGALVIVVVRGDFLDRAMAHPQLAAEMEAGLFAVTPMTESELRQAITGPATEAGLTGAEDVADAVIAELRRADSDGGLGDGVLPLVSQAMADTWERREEGRLTVRAYQRAGGAADAINRSAQAAYDGLSQRQQEAARLVFTRLTVVTPDGQLERCRSSRADLHAPPAGGLDPSDIDAVIDAFSDRRLLVAGDDGIEVAHDVLLRAWRQVRDWLGDDLIDRALYSRVLADARAWEASDQDPAYLYQPGRLSAIAAAMDRWENSPTRYAPLPAIGTEFLRAARTAAGRGVRRRRAVIAGLLALALAAVAGVVVARGDAATAARQHAIALSRQLASDSLAVDGTNPVGARRLAIAAYHVFPTAQASSAITDLITEQEQQRAIPADPASVSGVAFSPDGKLLGTAGGSGTVRLWDPETGQPVGAPLQASGTVDDVAFSPDGKLLASADSDGTIRLWNLETGRLAGAPLRAGDNVYGLAFSPDGKLLASAGSEDEGGTDVGSVRLWNPLAARPLDRTLHVPGGANTSYVSAVAFSPGGRFLASADSDGTVRLWDPATGRLLGRPLQVNGGSEGYVAGVAFSPDGKLLASAGSDGVVRLWNSATQNLVTSIDVVDSAENLGFLDAIAFSPDGSRLASADSSGTIRLWKTATGTPAGQPMRAGASGDSASPAVNGIAFSPDGKILASGNSSGMVQLWNAQASSPLDTSLQADPGFFGGVTGVAFSPDGRLLATADYNATVRLWSTENGQVTGAPLAVHAAFPISGVAFSHNGKLLASADGHPTGASGGDDGDGDVRLWDPATASPVGPPLHGTGPPASVSGVAFSPDGKILASGYGDGTIRLWNPATGQPIGSPLRAVTGPNASVQDVAFSPDGEILASADSRGAIRLWNLETGRSVGAPLQAATGPHASVQAVAFSPDGKILASAGSGGIIRLWNPATGRPLGRPLLHGDHSRENPIVNGVAFSPDGKILASADGDGTIRLWNPATGRPLGRPLRAGTGVHGAMSDVAFSPDGQLLAASSGDGLVGLWAVSLVAHPYGTLCADVGPPTRKDWHKYAPAEPWPGKFCGQANP